MVRQILLVGIVTVFSFSITASLRAADGPSTAPAPAVDEAVQKKIDSKSKRLIAAAQIDDPAKAERVKSIIGNWLVTMWDWHKQNDADLSSLWSQWSKARSGPSKDEFPAEIIARKIEDVYGTLQPAYQTFLTQLATELTPEQIDAIKEVWSRSPGMARTYNAYLQIVPDLTDDQKKIIHDRMVLAREAAMLTDNSKEIVSIYKIHKLKVEEYVGALEWAKMLSAFAHKGDAAPTATTAPAADAGK